MFNQPYPKPSRTVANRKFYSVLLSLLAAGLVYGAVDDPIHDVVASIKGQDVAASELGSELQDRLLRSQTESYVAKIAAVRTLLNEKVLQMEATSRGISVAEMLKLETKTPVTEPSSEEVKAAYEAADQRSMNDLSSELKLALTRERLLHRASQRAETRFIESLWDKFAVRILLDPPR